MNDLTLWRLLLPLAAIASAVAVVCFWRWRVVRDGCLVLAAVFAIASIPLLVPVQVGPTVSSEQPLSGESASSAENSSTAQSALPRPATDAGYVASDACRDCHQDQYASWYRTYHRTMTQPATPQTVIPSFDDVTLASRGRTYHLEQRGDEFWVDMIDPVAEVRAFVTQVDLASLPKPPRSKCQIVMTTGSHHHQTYWLQMPSGTLIQFPWVYHIEQKRWVFRMDSFLEPAPDAAMHEFNVWNLTCLGCHSTGGQPRVDRASGTMHSAAELGIACEACHGPGAHHVAVREMERFGKTRFPTPSITTDIVNPALEPPESSVQICGQCHYAGDRIDPQAWLAIGDPYRPGENNFYANRRLRQISDERDLSEDSVDVLNHSVFWPDGAVRTGGREYNGLIESPCYTHGDAARQMTCLSCHSMHASDPDKLVARGMETNLGCTQCHGESQYTDRLAEHTHHPPESSGSLCYNCHMTRTSYALFMATRSHRIDSPAARTTTDGARPNACNLCHLDQTVAWTADVLEEWYGIPQPELSDDEQMIAASLLWALRGDAAQRAVTAWHMGWESAWDASGDAWLAPFLAEMLVDPYGAVRYMAAESLERLPGCEGVENKFDAPPEERQRERRKAIDIWRGQALKLPADTSGLAVLLKGRNVLDHEVRRLKAMRDETPVAIFE